jgi:hypothetical protein
MYNGIYITCLWLHSVSLNNLKGLILKIIKFLKFSSENVLTSSAKCNNILEYDMYDRQDNSHSLNGRLNGK